VSLHPASWWRDSQGGAVALTAGLRFPQRLAGLLALSTYLPFRALLAAEKSAANSAVPILMCHGRADSVLPIAMGLHAASVRFTSSGGRTAG